MSVMVVEDNYLVGEMIRLAVEDANMSVVGPVADLAECHALVGRQDLNGAFLDINIGGAQSYPIARLLRSKGVPFIFVSGYDRSVLPQDLQDSTLISKPVFIGELTRITVDRFSAPVDRSRHAKQDMHTRAALIRSRIEKAEVRIRTQKRRLEMLQFKGGDPEAKQVTASLLDQIQIAADIMKDTLRAIERSEREPASQIERPISDDFIAVRNDRDVHAWAARFAISAGQLRELLAQVGPSVMAVRQALDNAAVNGPPKRARG